MKKKIKFSNFLFVIVLFTFIFSFILLFSKSSTGNKHRMSGLKKYNKISNVFFSDMFKHMHKLDKIMSDLTIRNMQLNNLMGYANKLFSKLINGVPFFRKNKERVDHTNYSSDNQHYRDFLNSIPHLTDMRQHKYKGHNEKDLKEKDKNISNLNQEILVNNPKQNNKEQPGVQSENIQFSKSLVGIIELNQRQMQILDFIKNFDKVNMIQLHDKFGYVSQRTLRRDMDKLQSAGFVVQEGRTRDTVYIVNK